MQFPGNLNCPSSTRRLLLHTEPYWQSTIVDGSTKSVTIDNVYVVFRVIGSYLMLIGGINEVDELILADVIGCLQKVLSEILGDCRDESSIMDAENYAKLSVSIDEMMPQVSY